MWTDTDGLLSNKDVSELSRRDNSNQPRRKPCDAFPLTIEAHRTRGLSKAPCVLLTGLCLTTSTNLPLIRVHSRPFAVKLSVSICGFVFVSLCRRLSLP